MYYYICKHIRGIYIEIHTEVNTEKKIYLDEINRYIF